MTKQNCTVKKRGKQSGIKIGCAFTNKLGSTATVIEYIDRDNIVVMFDDKRKTICTFYANALRKGSFKNPYQPSVFGVGFVGVGQYKTSEGGKATIEGSVWRDMLRRCYDNDYLDRNPSYIGCSVHPDWHNFQVFAEWYKNHRYYDLGYQLDKDISVKGNSVYSEHTCRLIPHEINTLLTDARASRGVYPQGVGLCSWGKRYRASIRCGSGKPRKQIGVYDTVEEASNAYRNAKKEQIIQRAIKWKGSMDDDVFESLIDIAANF